MIMENSKNIKLFFKRVSASMDRYSDNSMDLKAETHDFGIDMDLGNKVSMVEKMDSSECFWKLEF